MWFKSCEALTGQKSGRKPDSEEALLPIAERLARWSRREKWQVMWSAERQVGRLGQWDRSEQLCVTVQEEVFIRTWKPRHLRMSPRRLQAFIAVSLNAAHSSVSGSDTPCPGPSLNSTKLFLVREVRPTNFCSSGLHLSAGGDMSLRDAFKYTTWGLMAYFLHAAKSRAHPSGCQILQSCCSPVK